MERVGEMVREAKAIGHRMKWQSPDAEQYAVSIAAASSDGAVNKEMRAAPRPVTSSHR